MTATDATATDATPTAADVTADGETAPSVGSETRGTTKIADRVVQRIAVRAAQETADVRGPGGARQNLPGADDRPRVSVTVDGEVATMRITLGIAYPGSVRAATREVRAAVHARVRELTGISVRQLDIEVARLLVAGEQRRVVR